MFRNYLKISFRNLWKNRLFSALNIVGMGVGIAAVGLMMLYVWHELSYDRFHANANRICRVVHYAQWAGGNLQLAPTTVMGVIADVPTNSHVQFSALRSLPTNYTNGWQSFDLYTVTIFALVAALILLIAGINYVNLYTGSRTLPYQSVKAALMNPAKSLKIE